MGIRPPAPYHVPTPASCFHGVHLPVRCHVPPIRIPNSGANQHSTPVEEPTSPLRELTLGLAEDVMRPY
jgi:hypothetical protein